MLAHTLEDDHLRLCDIHIVFFSSANESIIEFLIILILYDIIIQHFSDGVSLLIRAILARG